MCGSMADIQYAAAEIRWGKKRQKKKKKNKPQYENISADWFLQRTKQASHSQCSGSIMHNSYKCHNTSRWATKMKWVTKVYDSTSMSSHQRFTQTTKHTSHTQLHHMPAFQRYLEMWANAQHDGRPAEYRWHPLFNAEVWLTPTTRVLCSNTAKMRNPLKFAGVPQTRQRISAVSGPKFTILPGYVEEVLVFSKFFSTSRYMP